MLYAGLDLSRKRLDFHLLDAEGATVDVGASPPDADGLRGLSERLDRHGAPIRAAIESMNGARFVHDRLELAGWQVEIADAQKVKGLAPLACKTDRIDAWVLAELSRRDLVPAIWLPSFEMRQERDWARWRLFLVRKRTAKCILRHPYKSMGVGNHLWLFRTGFVVIENFRDCLALVRRERRDIDKRFDSIFPH